MIHNIMIFVGLLVALWFTAANISRMVFKKSVPAINFFVMALGWTTFICFMWIF